MTPSHTSGRSGTAGLSASKALLRRRMEEAKAKVQPQVERTQGTQQQKPCERTEDITTTRTSTVSLPSTVSPPNADNPPSAVIPPGIAPPRNLVVKFLWGIVWVLFLPFQLLGLVPLSLAIPAVVVGILGTVYYFPCAVLETVAAELPVGSAPGIRIPLGISLRIICGVEGADGAAAGSARGEYGEIPPAAAAAASFPSMSDAIVGTADVVALLLKSNAEHAIYVSSSVMPSKEILDMVDEAVRQHFQTRLPAEQEWYRAFIRAIQTWPATAQLRQSWFSTPGRRRKAKQTVLRRAKELLNRLGVAVEEREGLVIVLSGDKTTQATSHISRNMCNWKSIVERNPRMVSDFVDAHNSWAMAGMSNGEDGSNVDSPARESPGRASAEISRARILCHGSVATQRSWNEMHDRVDQREMEDLRSAQAAVEDLVQAMTRDGRDSAELDEVDEWESKLIDIVVRVLRGMNDVYSIY